MSDSLDKISAGTGFSRATLLELWDEVKQNAAKAKVCDGHTLTPYVPFSIKKRTCTKCGAWFTFEQCRAIEHAGRP